MKYKYEQDKAKYMRKKCERNKLVKIAIISLILTVVCGVMMYINMIAGLGFLFVIMVCFKLKNKM